MKNSIIFDACALISFLNDEPGSNVIEDYLKKALKAENNIFLHKINLLEIYYGIFREDSEKRADLILSKILSLPTHKNYY